MTHLSHYDAYDAPIRRRAAKWATLLGVAIGGGLGTLFFPIIGTAIGAVVGGFVGVCLGAANGCVLVAATRTRCPIGVAMLACAAVSGATAYAICVVLAQSDMSWRIGISVLCAALAAGMGPAVLVESENQRRDEGIAPR